VTLWNGKPIEELESSHIERILSACQRGVWADGRPCRVRFETQRALREELKSRGSGDFLPEKVEPPPGVFAPPVPPPKYDDVLNAMGYAPPPIPPPIPWSPPVKTKIPMFPSLKDESLEPKGNRLVEKLQAEIDELRETLADRDSVLRQLTRRLTRQKNANDQLREEMEARAKERDRVNQPMAKRLEGMERRASGDDLEDIDEAALIAWWREEIEDCSGALVRGLNRLLGLAARGIDVKTIKPRQRKRPGIQRDK